MQHQLLISSFLQDQFLRPSFVYVSQLCIHFVWLVKILRAPMRLLYGVAINISFFIHIPLTTIISNMPAVGKMKGKTYCTYDRTRIADALDAVLKEWSRKQIIYQREKLTQSLKLKTFSGGLDSKDDTQRSAYGSLHHWLRQETGWLITTHRFMHDGVRK